MVASSSRSVERVPALFVGLLEEAGKLPSLPRFVDAHGEHAKARTATLAEVAALTWLVAWDGPKVDANGFRKPVGVGAYRDVYDYHTASDVREIIHVAGSRRACIDLVRFMMQDKVKCVGCIGVENTDMFAVLKALGGEVTRVYFEGPR